MSEYEIDIDKLAEETIASAFENMSNQELAGLLEENTAILRKAALRNQISTEELKTATFYVTKISKIFENKP